MTEVVRFIGDVHGKFDAYKRIIRDAPISLQVGDMGVGFRDLVGGEFVWSRNPPYDAMSNGRHRFIRGNHDNPEVCARQDFWIPDGSIVDGIFCLGGATSIDRAYRVEHLNWWADEECSREDMDRHIDTYARVKPKIVASHEAPESVADALIAHYRKRKFDDPSRTRGAVQRMLDIHRPRLWVFGHWHLPFSATIGGTEFRCFGRA